jgi:AraC-like DNA-binding protein
MVVEEEMLRSFRFSTVGPPTPARGAAVRELHERGVIPLEPLPGRTAHVDIGTWFLPGACIMTGTLSGLRQHASPRAIGASDDLFVGVNLAGCSAVAQRRHEITLKSGDAAVLSSAEGPFTIDRPTPVRFLGVRVPRRAIVPLLGRHAQPGMRVVPATTEPIRLLTTYARVVSETQTLVSPDTCRLIATHLHDLVALSLGATPDAAEAARNGGVAAARLHAVKADIAMNCADEALTLSTLAARHGVTPRYVHRLFEREGITYTQFVLRLRLEEAYRRLRDPRRVKYHISAIAYDVGFGDLSYFNRAFRRRYGATPSEIRNSPTSLPI